MNFSTIPANVLQPLFYVETNGSKAAGGPTPRPSLCVGQKLPSGTATANVPVRVSSGAEADVLFGFGSQLAREVRAYIANDPVGELWAIPVADDGGAAPATGQLTITGPATGAGSFVLYIAGQRLAIAVVSGDSATTIALAIKAALGVDEAAALVLKSQFPVTANNVAGVMTFTARNKGPVGNRIDLRVNYLGSAGGEALPAGVIATFVAMSAGATNPGLSTMIAAMGDKRFSYIAQPWTDATSLDAWKAEHGDTASGRWGYVRQLYGSVFSADVDTYGNLSVTVLAAALKNDPHMFIMGVEACPTPPYEIAGAYAARAAASGRSDRSMHLNNLELIGVLAPAVVDQFSYSEREVLLGVGITTPAVTGFGSVLIQRAVSTYTKNAGGAADAAYRDFATCENIDQCLTELRSYFTGKYGRCKLVNDGAGVGGPGICTPNTVRGDFIAIYKGWTRLGYVEDVATFKKLLIVERDAVDPNRLNVLFPPDLANGLHVLAVLNEFRLQYSAAEVAA